MLLTLEINEKASLGFPDWISLLAMCFVISEGFLEKTCCYAGQFEFAISAVLR